MFYKVPEISYLIFSLFLFTVVWWFWPQEFVASDQWGYSRIAYRIASDLEFYDEHIFAQRLGVTIPVAIIYFFLGVSIHTTNLLPLLSVWVIISVVWFSLNDIHARLLGMLFSLTSGVLILNSIHLFPDIVTSAFMSLSFLFFIRRHKSLSPSENKYIPYVFVFTLFMAFSSKLTSYWVLLPISILMIRDIMVNDFNKLFKCFYLPVIFSSLFLMFFYLYVCEVIWGNVFSRFSAVDDFSKTHLWNMDVKDLLLRLSLKPVKFFIFQFGVFIFLLPWVIRLKSDWVLYFFSCLFLFWFGFSGFSSYQPLPLFPRMVAPMIPALIILSVLFVDRFAKTNNRHGIFYSLLLVFFINGPQLFLQSVDAIKTDFGEEKALSRFNGYIDDLRPDSVLLITSDTRSPKSLLFYYEYNLPEMIKMMSLEDFLQAQVESDHYFYYENTPRTRYLSRAYGHNAYFLESLGFSGKSLYLSEKVSLIKLSESDKDELLVSYSSDK